MINYNNLRKVLKDWGDKFSTKLKNYLNTAQGSPPSKFRASGRTSESIKPIVQKTRGKDEIRLQFKAYANKGRVIPDILNNGQRPSSAKYPYKAIEQWLIDKNIELRWVNRKGKFVSPSRTPQNIRRSAFAISKSIREKGTSKRFGYRGADIYKNLFFIDQPLVTQTVSEALEKDFRDYINKQAKTKK